MKRVIVSLIMITGVATLVSANGMGGRRNNNEWFEDRAERHEDILEDEEIVSITGKLVLENGEMAKLESNGTTYYLMAPFQYLTDLEVKDGQKVTIEGAERVLPMQWDNKEKSFIIKSVTINGKTTELNFDNYPAPMGFGGGMMGQRKPQQGNRGARPFNSNN